jgi:hypothetical protein
MKSFIDDVFFNYRVQCCPIAFEVLLRVKLPKMLYVP